MLAAAILIAIAVLSAVLWWHEMGHYWTARCLGMPVRQVSLGVGPKLWAWRAKDVEWSIGVVFFFGFVKVEPIAFMSSSRTKRMLFYAGGPGGNFLLGVALLVVAGVLGQAGAATPDPFTGGVIGGVTRAWFEMRQVVHGALGVVLDPFLSQPISALWPIAQRTPAMGNMAVRILSSTGEASIGVGALNLFPIPLADGGRLLILGAEALFGRSWADIAERVFFLAACAVAIIIGLAYF